VNLSNINLRKIALGSFITTFILIISFSLWHYRHRSLSEDPNTTVFLGTVFGMSESETRKALKKYAADLIARDPFYQNLEHTQAKDVFFISELTEIVAELKKTKETILYMPPIKMFKSSIVAAYGFIDHKLSFIEVHVFPISPGDSNFVVESIVNHLKSKYTLIEKEPSTTIPEAYTLRFKNKSASVSLWVNLSKKNKPIIGLDFDYTAARKKYESKVHKREQNAF
jgi:hypothetical protein